MTTLLGMATLSSHIDTLPYLNYTHPRHQSTLPSIGSTFTCLKSKLPNQGPLKSNLQK